jgi:putative membrane protein
MMWDGGWTLGWMAPLMGVSAVLWWVLVIAVVLAVLRWWRMPADAGTTPRQDARQVLDVRFARGEIDADEYAARRRAMAE